MSISAKDLATYIRETVSFDFSKETISSYDQIRKRHEDFFVVENPHAFKALLNDVIGRDNQLIDVFIDLQMADRGFRYFANWKNRDNPHIAISAFLNVPRFGYHTREIGKVYFAVNTWLCFFGAKEIDAIWQACPICGGKLSNDVCTTAGCNKKQSEMLPIMLELQDLLESEAQGIEVVLPKYYKKIAPTAQFGIYKTKIDEFREKRNRHLEAEKTIEQRKLIILAESELNKITAKLKVETAKENPSFDVLLDELNTNTAILNALRCTDVLFRGKVDKFVKSVQQQKEMWNQKKERALLQKSMEYDCREFVNAKARIEAEILNAANPPLLSEIQSMLAYADEKYEKVYSCSTKQPGILTASETVVLVDYKNNVRPKVVDMVEKAQHTVFLDCTKDKLMITLGELEKEYQNCSNLQDGAHELWDRFVDEVEKNKDIIDCREDLAWDAQYVALTTTLKTNIEDLLNLQCNAKIEALLQYTEPLKKELRNSLPKHKRANKIKQKLTEIQMNSYFGSIRRGAIYQKEISELDYDVSDLESRESTYFRRKGNIVRGLTITAAVITVVMFILIAWIIPTTKMDYRVEKNENGKYEVVGAKDDKNEVLVISEHLPYPLLIKNNAVVAIAENAFLNNAVLRKCVIPAGVERIESGAFKGCTNLNTIVLQSTTPPSVDKTSFEKHKVVFLVPAQNYQAYVQASDWAEYIDMIFPFYENEQTICTVMFDSCGGSSVENIYGLALNTLVDPMPLPERFGYLFDGWYYYDNDGKEQCIDSSKAIFKRSTKLFAKWSCGVYSVSFDFNDGSGRKDVGQFTYGNTWEEIPEPRRNGYTFDGWYLNGERIHKTDKVNIGESVTLIAQWTPLQYTVSFDYSGGKGNADSMMVTFDREYGLLPIPSRTGYIFGGWMLNGETLESNAIVDTAEDHMLVANWIANAYTIRYVTNGGAMLGEDTVVCRYDEIMTLITPYRIGYQFSYWECNGVQYSGGQQVMNLVSDTTELVFEAYWKPIRYTIIYETEGGAVPSDTVTCTYNQDVVVATPRRTGHTFLYWTYDSQQIAAGEIVSNLAHIEGEEVVLRAVWWANQYTVQYELMGGTQNTLSIDCVYDLQFVLETPTRSGYDFLYWQLGDSTYSGGQTVENLTALNDGIVVLTAVWEANKNTLRFDGNLGQGEMSSITVSSDNTVALPLNIFTREGYTFIGWSSSPSGVVEYADGGTYTMGITSDNVLYAVWQANTNTLILIANNGTDERLEYSFETNEMVQIPANIFVRAGYVFAGWRTPESTLVEYSDEGMYVMPTEKMSLLIAVWTPLENILVFDANGGDGEEVTQIIPSGATKVLLSCTYTNEGYRFVGWSSFKNGEVNYLDSANYTMGTASEVRLYAVWEPIVYEIFYQLDGGENSPMNKDAYTIRSETIVLYDPQKLGYTFEGWYGDAEKTVKVTEIDARTLTTVKLYANFIANKNTVVFYAGGGEGEMSSVTVKTDQMIILPSCEFTRVGYEFVGWSTSLSGEVYYLDHAEYHMGIKQEYVLYAVWEKVIYSIDYRINGGQNHPDNPISYHVESADIVLESPSRVGYTFGGWYMEPTMTTAAIDTIIAGSYGNKTLYANWLPKENVLRFDANGGLGSMREIILKTGEILVSLPTVTFEKAGYNFAGWARTANGNSIYADGASFEMGAEEEITLYAVWTDFSYSISYNLNGGTNNQQNPVGYKVSSETFKLQPPTRAGYTFDGWYTDNLFEKEITEILNGSVGHLVVYAKWIANQNILVFNPNGGSGTMEDMLMYTDDSAMLTPVSFVKVGYRFAGWSTFPDGDVVYEDQTVYTMGPDAIYTLYAKWTPNENTIIFNANGGSGSMTNQYMNTDQSVALNKNTFYMTGYHFVGWALSASGDVVYTNAAKYTMGSDSTYTLYAKWEPNINTLVFDANGGSGHMSNLSIATYAAVELPKNSFTRTGYRFVGWATSSNGSVMFVDEDKYYMKTASSYTLYACWEPLNYDIIVNRSNASVKITVGSIVYDNPEKVSVPCGSKFIISYSSNFSNYATLNCTLDGVPIADGYGGTMPAMNITVSASSTEQISTGGSGDGSCLAEGTMIMLANGSSIPIEKVKVGDRILAFDHATGSFVENEVGFVFFANANVVVAKLAFENGATLTVVNSTGHGMFNVTLNQYVLVTPHNVDCYVGDAFAWVNENGDIEVTELISYTRYEDCINRYDVVTEGSFNCIANNFLVCSDVLVNVCNVFAFASDLTYDAEKLQADVQTYGLYTYNEWRRHMTEEEFEIFGGAYFKIAVGKNLITENDIFMLLWFLHSWSN